MLGMILHNWGNRLMLCCNHIVLNTHTEQYYGSATVQRVGPGTDSSSRVSHSTLLSVV